jgi:hypothetical protein
MMSDPLIIFAFVSISAAALVFIGWVSINAIRVLVELRAQGWF